MYTYTLMQDTEFGILFLYLRSELKTLKVGKAPSLQGEGGL